MPTWEDLLGPFVGLAHQFQCATCLNQIFRGSTGLWGQKVILNKIAPAGGLRDEKNHAITFQCEDCTGREPVMCPVVHPNGQVVNHINISELQDSQDQTEIKRVTADYDKRAEQTKEIKDALEQKTPLSDSTTNEIAEEIGEEKVEEMVNDPEIKAAEEKIDAERKSWEKKKTPEEEREAVDTVDKEEDI